MSYKENRAKSQNDRAETQPDDRETRTAGPSQLGKEAKIGVTVILLLIVGLVGALAYRLTRSGDDAKLASAAASPAEKPKAADSVSAEALFKDFRAKPSAGRVAPTVVSAKAGPPLKPPKTFESDSNRWQYASNQEEPKPAGSRRPDLSVPPPTLPGSPPTAPESRYGSIASDAPKSPPRSRYESMASDPPPLPRREKSRYESSSDAPPSTSPSTLPPLDALPRTAPHRAAQPPAAPPDTLYPDVVERPVPAAPVSRDGGDGEPHRHNPPPSSSNPPPSSSNPPPSSSNPPPSSNNPPPSYSNPQSHATPVSTRQSYRSGRPYTVAEGDTLFNIARYELGKASRWVEIYELNSDLLGKDINYLAGHEAHVARRREDRHACPAARQRLPAVEGLGMRG